MWNLAKDFYRRDHRIHCLSLFSCRLCQHRKKRHLTAPLVESTDLMPVLRKCQRLNCLVHLRDRPKCIGLIFTLLFEWCMMKSLPFLYSSGHPNGDICIDISDAGKRSMSLFYCQQMPFHSQFISLALSFKLDTSKNN